MGFTDILSDSGMSVLNNWLTTRSYIVGYAPSQADVAVYKALEETPASSRYPYVARWYEHIASLKDDFAALPGDPAAPYTDYGPEDVTATVSPAKAPATEDEDDDVDLFGSDDEEDENDEAAKIREQRLEEYRKKKEAKGPKPAAKSLVTLDVKPWDDETDLAAMEAAVRGIEKDGLVWGASKFDAIGFGISKLQIILVVEDEKVSTDQLQEQIQDFEDYVQSTDIVSMQKL